MRVLWCCTLLTLASFAGCAENVETSKSSNSSTDAGLKDKIDKLEAENRSLRDELEALQEQFANVSESAKSDRDRGDGWFDLSPSPPSTLPVTGRVLYDGAPVEGATVTFMPASDGIRPAIGVTDAAGAFTLSCFENGDGATPGEYHVTVTKTEIGEEEELVLEDEGAEPVVRNFLPEKYSSAATSGLVCEVKADAENDFTLDLTY